jgi:hypothetical protein
LILSDPRVHADWLEEQGDAKTSLLLRRLASLHPHSKTENLLKEIKKRLENIDWNTCNSVLELATAIDIVGELDARRARLFCCWCIRQFTPLIDERDRKALEVAERYTEGKATNEEVYCAQSLISENIRHTYNHKHNCMAVSTAIWCALALYLIPKTLYDAVFAVTFVAKWDTDKEDQKRISATIEKASCDKIRELWSDSLLASLVGGSR